MQAVENRLEINHRHLSASNKREDVLLELIRHRRMGALLELSLPISHMEPTLVCGCLPLLDLFKIDEHALHTFALRIHLERWRRHRFAAHSRSEVAWIFGRSGISPF